MKHLTAILAALLMGCGGSDEPESRDTANPPQCAASAGACV